MHRDEVNLALRSWEGLNKALRQMTLTECYTLLKIEGKSQRRESYINRIITRISTMEGDRVRKKLRAKYL